jgi:hypothetical protein
MANLAIFTLHINLHLPYIFVGLSLFDINMFLALKILKKHNDSSDLRRHFKAAVYPCRPRKEFLKDPRNSLNTKGKIKAKVLYER